MGRETENHATKAFISYRHDDSGGHAGRLLDRLVREFGTERLFFDVDSIPLGKNFPKVLREEVAKCSALIAVIGPTWLDARNKEGKRRLDDPNDFVRIEVAAALERDIPVIPVFIDGAKIPPLHELPNELKELGLRNGLEVRHTSFQRDMDRLVQDLRTQMDGRHTPGADAAAANSSGRSAQPTTAPPKMNLIDLVVLKMYQPRIALVLGVAIILWLGSALLWR